MPDKLNNDLKKGAMVTPISTEPGKPDPGPPILNNPVENPSDVLGFIPKMGKTSK
jgi:hypothetical protein